MTGFILLLTTILCYDAPKLQSSRMYEIDYTDNGSEYTVRGLCIDYEYNRKIYENSEQNP